MLNHRTRVIANDTISERASDSQERLRVCLDPLCHAKCSISFLCGRAEELGIKLGDLETPTQTPSRRLSVQTRVLSRNVV